MRAVRVSLSCFLLLGLGMTALAKDEATEKVDKTMEAYQQAYQMLLAEYQREQDAEKKQAIVGRLPEIYKEFAEKFQAISEEYPKTDGAASALAMVSQFAPRHPDTKSLADAAKQSLLAEHINSKGLVPAIGMLGRDASVLDKLINESTSREVQGVALFYKMNAAKGRELTEQNIAEVKPLIERIQKDYGDVHLMLAGGMDRGALADLVGNELFAFENLRVGKQAPEIKGEDVEGVAFKLSDYRGKVVVVDFWGDW